MADWTWFVALDGEDLDGLIGEAGLLRFAWPDKKIIHRFYDGISGGHNVSICPNGQHLLLGNMSQQIVVVNCETLDVLQRVTTMGVEECDYRLRANTHHLWYDDKTFLAAIGDHLYTYDLADLAHPKRLVPHRLWNVHEMRWTKDKRYVLLADMGPEDSGARQVGVYDQQTKEISVIRLPGTVWHTAVHPTKNLGYAATYSFSVEDEDYVDWAPAYAREYIFEIDLENAVVSRVWSSSAAFPVHLNSDLEIYGEDAPMLYVASGGSHTVVEVELEDFERSRVREVVPGFWSRLWNWRADWRQWKTNFVGALLRKSAFTGMHLILQTYKVTQNRTFDGVYCVRASPDGKYLIAGNRGYNYIRVMDRQSLGTVYETRLPLGPRDLHLGLHHSEMRRG